MNIWMIRAGEGGRLAEEFAKGYVAVGWNELGDMTTIKDREEMRKHHLASYPTMKKGAIPNDFSMFFKFRSVVAVGDNVVTYDVSKREYLVGTIAGDYEYKQNLVGDYPHVRKVDWKGRVSRDSIPTSSKNILGSTLTLFSVPQEVWDDLQRALNGERLLPEEIKKEEEEESTLETIRRDTIERAHEFIKDRILKLDPDEMEELVAALLRGMGYKARVTPKGPDRGVDVFASPDGLGLEEPRIKTEVKHRPNTSMGSQEIRSFLGGLRAGDRGIYVSTGGYTKEAKYEADRATVPVTLLTLDDLASLVVTYYESFDLNGRALIPLVRVYWPAE